MKRNPFLTVFFIVAAFLLALVLPGCLSAPQEQTQRAATSGDRTGTTPATIVVAQGHNTINLYTQPPATQPSGNFDNKSGTMTLTVTGATQSNKAGTSGETAGGAAGGGSQTSEPTNTPKVEVPVNFNTPGSVGGVGK